MKNIKQKNIKTIKLKTIKNANTILIISAM